MQAADDPPPPDGRDLEGVAAVAGSADGRLAERLAAGGVVTVEVRGGSMRPTLLPGDRITVGAPGRPPRPGEVVLIRYPAFVVLHRLVARFTLRGVTRCVHVGDAAGCPPGLCRAEDLLGVADLPHRPQPLRRRAAWTARALLQALRSRLRLP